MWVALNKKKKESWLNSEEFTNQNFCNIDHSGKNIDGISFYNCTFTQCSFSNSVIASSIFEGCNYIDSDLSMARFSDSSIPECSFNKCRLNGIDWSQLKSKIGIKLSMRDCDLSYSTFIDMDLSESKLLECRIHEADFTGTILKKSRFTGSDLLRTVFSGTDLREADLRRAYNYFFDPGKNKCKGVRLSHIEAIDLLEAYGIRIE